MTIRKRTGKSSGYSRPWRAGSLKPHVFALLLVIVTVSSCTGPTHPPDYGIEEDYRIYDVVLGEDLVRSGATIVLWDTTQTTVYSSDNARIARLKENLPGLEDETLARLIAANESPVKLMRVVGIDNLVMSSEYAGGADSQAVRVSLSKVGYNRMRTQAVVEVGVMWAPLAGSGTLVFLTKENGLWKVTARCMTWIS